MSVKTLPPEFELISQLVQLNPDSFASGVVGPGDDCAVIPVPGTKDDLRLVFTTDAFIEDVHFKRSYMNATDVGWKTVAATVSDIAAMGAVPIGCVLSCQLPGETDSAWLSEFYQGAYAAAKEFSSPIVGGDVVASQTLGFTCSAVGTSEKAPLLRSGAADGDDIWVSGDVGASAAGLAILQENIVDEKISDKVTNVINAHTRPIARVELGQYLLEHDFASSLIDISDGLLQDATHLAKASGVDFLISPTSIPIRDEVKEMRFAEVRCFTGGEDYELLFSASRENRRKLEQCFHENDELPAVTRIGAVSPAVGEPGVFLLSDRGDPVPCARWLEDHGLANTPGFQHF